MLYKSSKGDVEVSTMPLSYAKNALNKLLRTEPEREAEIEALDTHVRALEAKASEEALNPRAVIGANNPPPDEPVPVITGRSAIDMHVADLMVEAANWADGAEIDNQDQADAVGRLCRMLQQAATLVDDAAAKEKKPHNDALTEIGAWQNGYTAKGLKKTPDGKLTKAIKATTSLSGAWLRKLDDERKQREQAAADAAREAAQVAIAAHAEAKVTTDIAVMDRAEDALAEAKSLLKQAEGVAKERVAVGGGDGFRAMTLRTVYHAVSTGEERCWNMALNHYLAIPEFATEMRALIQKWADRDALNEVARLRGVPGFKFDEERKAA